MSFYNKYLKAPLTFILYICPISVVLAEVYMPDADAFCITFYRDEATQVACLQLVEIMVPSMGGADVAYVLPHVTSFATHPSVQCRQLMYTILIAIYSSS